MLAINISFVYLSSNACAGWRRYLSLRCLHTALFHDPFHTAGHGTPSFKVPQALIVGSTPGLR